MATNPVNRKLKFWSGLNAVIMSVSVIGVLGGINYLGAERYQRWDMTEAQVHSLSEASIEAAQSLEGLKIRIYQSERLPKTLQGPGGVSIENVPRLLQQLDDKLDEYLRASNGGLEIEIISDDLETRATALSLVALRVPAEATDDVDPEAVNKRYYLGMALHYRRVEEVIPLLSNPASFEYEITRALLRLRDKQEAASVMRSLLDTGEDLNKAVEGCVEAIQRHTQSEQSDDSLEGGLVEQYQSAQSDRGEQVNAYLSNLASIDAACAPVSTLLAQQRADLAAGASQGRQLSREHFGALLDKIGWFDGIYGAWTASLINEARDPQQLPRLTALLRHPEIPARTSALRVLGGWLQGGEGQPPLQGPPHQQAITALRASMQDPEAVVRSLTVQILASVTGEAASTEVLAALKDEDGMVREIALDLLMRLGLEVGVEPVKPFLADPNWQVRRMALVYLAQKAKDAATLRPLLDDSSPEVRLQAAYELAQLRDATSVPKIQELISSLPAGQARELIRTELEKMDAENAPVPETDPTSEPIVPTSEPVVPTAEEPVVPTPAAPVESTEAAPAPAPPPVHPLAVPVPGPAYAQTPGGPGDPPAPSGGGLGRALGRAGLDRLGDMQLPDPLQGPEILENLKQEISTAYNTLKDSPGRKTIGFLCGHEEFCPFAETDSKIPDELVQAFAQQPFIKKAVDDIKGLEQRLNQHNEAIRGFFVSRGYRVVQAAAGAPVSDEVDALIVFGPRTAFSDLDLYDLDQYILTGKPVVFFIANYNVEVNQWDDEPPYNLVRTIESTDTNINPFLAHYGIQNNTDLVMETQRGLYDVINTVVMQMSNLGELPMAAKYSYPLFPKFESFSDDDLLVAGLRRVTLPFVSSFSAADTAHTDLHFEPLISSTENAVSKTEAFDLNPQTLKDSIVAEQTAGVVHVAAHVTGTDVSSFFAGRERPERPAPAAASPDEPAPEVPDEAAQRDQGPVNIVVIGSTLGFENLSPSRILQDFNLGAVAQEKVTGLGAAIPYFIRYVNIWGRLIGQQNPIHFGERGRLTQLPGQQAEFLVKPDDKGTDSLDLLFSIFDWATGDIGLGQIRAKIDTDRPLRVEGEKQQQGVVGFLVFGLPLLLIILGFVRHSLRRMGRQRLSVTVSSEEA